MLNVTGRFTDIGWHSDAVVNTVASQEGSSWLETPGGCAEFECPSHICVASVQNLQLPFAVLGGLANLNCPLVLMFECLCCLSVLVLPLGGHPAFLFHEHWLIIWTILALKKIHITDKQLNEYPANKYVPCMFKIAPITCTGISSRRGKWETKGVFVPQSV